MPRPSEVHSSIEKAVAEVLEAALPGLRHEIVARAAAAVSAVAPASGSSPTEQLSAAATAIQESNSQGDILRHLLEGASHFSSRVALFVVKGGSISGWQGTGFEDNELVKGTPVSAGRGLIAEAMNERIPASGSTANFDASFLATVKVPARDNCLVLPLVVKDKVAALIYADSGTSEHGVFDASALSVLTRFAALWLEASAMKKPEGAAPVTETAQAPSAMATQAPPAMASAAATAVASAPLSAPVSGDVDLHNKARRFAKLLVDEIMLYNKAKVNEGKKNQDLYTRLREDIEKSRATFDKRYGETAVASAGYFNQELVRILADNDVSLMGDGFPR